MAKKSASARGKKAWKNKVRDAVARGAKSVKVGKHRIPIAQAKASAGISGGGKGKGKGKRPRKKGPRTPGEAMLAAHRAAHPKPRKPRKPRKGGGRKSASRKPATRRGGGGLAKKNITVTKTRKAATVIVASERRRRGHRRGYSMENPIKASEGIAGGLMMLFGLAVADASDRFWATHALTPSTTAPAAGQAVTYTDPGAATGQAYAPAATASGFTSGLKNGAAVLAPMNMTRWISGAAVTILPFALGSMTGGTTRTALHFFGFGAGARILGKALVDLFARLLSGTSIGQRLYVNELAATAQAQAMAGNPVTVNLPGQTTTPAQITSSTVPATSVTGLAGAACCQSCAGGNPGGCLKKKQLPVGNPPPPPPAYYPPAQPTVAAPPPVTRSAEPTRSLPAPVVSQQSSQPFRYNPERTPMYQRRH